LLNVFFLGLVSFFTDISAEMVYPLIPLYLTSAFGATPALIGVIEGIAESTAGLMKVYSGYVTDKFHKRKSLAFTGYLCGVIYKLVLLFASSWAGIMAARVIDRAGKGVRVAPRNSLLSDSADKHHLGKAFGLHKTLDMAGASLGILCTYFFLRSSADVSQYRRLFMIALVPAIVGLCMFVFVKDKQPERRKVNRSINLRYLFKSFKTLDRRLKLYLFIVMLFTLGNSSNTFLLLRASSVGYSDPGVILIFFVYHAVAAILSTPLGTLSDKVGRKKLIVSGYFVFAAAYFGFAFATGKELIACMFVLYGFFTAMTAGVERALITEIAPCELLGTMHGLQSTITGVALLPASIITGLLWNTFGRTVPFVYGASLALAAAVMLLVFMKSAGCVMSEES